MQKLKSTFDRSRCWLLNIDPEPNPATENSSKDSPRSSVRPSFDAPNRNSLDISKNGIEIFFKIPETVDDRQSLISPQDELGLSTFLKDLSLLHIIPGIERSISVFNDQVENTRKGLKNQVKGWLVGFGFASKKKDETEIKNPNRRYNHNSIEAIQKKLGDLLFLVQDYQTALDIYKTAFTDYSNDKVHTYLGAAHEMAALSQFFIDPSRKEVDAHIEKAFVSYGSGTVLIFSLIFQLFFPFFQNNYQEMR